MTEEIDLTMSDDDDPAEEPDLLPGGSQANAEIDPIELAAGLPGES